ncbi:MAG: glycoside hydrolase N-terminal domain-containing protein [Clostridia bacterium]|nr:glycoside hydrolase N-terminal domain-containing protein [Clostridia bacterium]
MERKVWYRRPAAAWEEALPLGNGALGMMVFGGVETERLQLSEETMWSGRPHDNDNPECLEYLEEMRRLLFAGKAKEAEALCIKYLVCKKGSDNWKTPDAPYGTYQTAGDVTIQMIGKPVVDSSHYRRELDIFDGVATVHFGTHTRRHLVSEKYGVTATEIVCKAPERLKVRFDRPNADVMYESQGNIVARGAFVGEGASSYCTVVSVVAPESVAEGGADSEAAGIFTHATTRFYIYTTTATSYKTTKSPEEECRERIRLAREAGFDKIYEEHVAAHREVMERAVLDLGGADRSAVPTDERLEAICRGEEDVSFAALYFHFGKYLLMSSSRGKLPANIQGIWVKDCTPPWSADFHININLQMMYWHAEILGLTEYMEPYFHYIEDLAEHGEKTAKVQYGCRGWVAHTIANPWGFTAPGNHPSWGAFACAGAWCCRDIYEHYLYTGDAAFLQKYYPLIRDSAIFFLDFLVTDPHNGCLVTAPSNSPENRYIDPVSGEAIAMCAGPTMDNSIIAELFDNAISCAEILGQDADLAEKWRAARAKLPPFQIGKHGQLLEWQEDYDEIEPGHRHMSHLYGVYPAALITKEKTPNLFEAAQVSINRRLENGGGHTGWSNAWIICFFARFLKGDRAYEMLKNLFQHGTYRNLFDHHPTVFFQMDGNHGATAGIAEMLLQSHEDAICVLPACPAAWKEGSFRGFRARGGFVIDAAWKNGTLTKLTVRSLLGNRLALRFADKLVEQETIAGKEYHLI